MWNVQSLRHRIFKIRPGVLHTVLLFCRYFHAPKRDAEWNKQWLVVWHVGQTASWAGLGQCKRLRIPDRQSGYARLLLACQSLDPEYKTTAFFQMHFQEKNIVLYSGQYSTNRGFVKKNVVRFRNKPRGDWFSFAKVENLVSFAPVNKLVRLAYLWGTCAAHTSYVIRWNGFRIWQLDEVREKCLLSLKYGYFG